MFNNTLATLRLLHAGQVLSDPPRLNPLYLSLGTNAYRIQSQTLGIPDHFGMFSASPPRLQAYEAGKFLLMGFVLLILLFWASFTLAVCWAARIKNFWWIALLFSALIVGTAACLWAACCQRTGRRAPGYVWKDWKVERWTD
ncbi:hypothetical protein P171DRAFT_431986 [Karstenula rhodostoma CBS 690.94]|uniref:Uncharacterized protein n=1 Tax=Karstenula rhodostoma CBS 690.94 TaxID=1392251 RepID=A0A9P4PJF5_9PLEO|nr:hypothetical protein P171DRAFT_431986 [Karstenula rhodostoma CBS 690.94]